jgi:hypothetical protein
MSDFQNNPPKKPAGLLAYLRKTKRYWLIPLLLAAIIVAILVGLGSSVLAPFLYPLF